MNATETFRISDGVTWDRSDGQVVILNPDGTEMLTLNEVGSVIWPELAQPVGLQQIVDTLAAQFADVDPATLRADLEVFLGDLGREGLISSAEV
ncbi:MAG: PqqD family protein [Microthrixaceae bacterium]